MNTFYFLRIISIFQGFVRAKMSHNRKTWKARKYNIVCNDFHRLAPFNYIEALLRNWDRWLSKVDLLSIFIPLKDFRFYYFSINFQSITFREQKYCVVFSKIVSTFSNVANRSWCNTSKTLGPEMELRNSPDIILFPHFKYVCMQVILLSLKLQTRSFAMNKLSEKPLKNLRAHFISRNFHWELCSSFQ